MMLDTARTWLWNNRKVLVTTLLVYGLLQGLFYLPQYLILWVGLVVTVLTMGVWWISGFDKDWKAWIWLLAELIWMVTAGVSFITFNLLGISAFQITVTLLIVGVMGLLMLYETYLAEGSWPIRFFSLLDFIDLVSFFFLSAGLLMASDLFSWSLMTLVVAVSIEALLAIQLRFWREKIESRRKWLYSVTMILLVQEMVWLTSFWHRGVFLKTFLVAMLFYVLTDFITHYLHGTLTVRVMLEYVGLVMLVMAGVFLIDWLVVLQ